MTDRPLFGLTQLHAMSFDQGTGFLISQHHCCVLSLARVWFFVLSVLFLFHVVETLLAELLPGLNLELWHFFCIIIQATAKDNKNFLNCGKKICGLHCYKSHTIKQVNDHKNNVQALTGRQVLDNNLMKSNLFSCVFFFFYINISSFDLCGISFQNSSLSLH